MLEVLERDIARLPALLAEEPGPLDEAPPDALAPDAEPAVRTPVQLGLF
jgi:hypothetical protein